MRPTASEDPVPIERMRISTATSKSSPWCSIGRLTSSAGGMDRGPSTWSVVDWVIEVEQSAPLAWEPFEYEPGTVLRIASAQIKRFRDTPELNFGNATRFERFHDATFPSGWSTRCLC